MSDMQENKESQIEVTGKKIIRIQTGARLHFGLLDSVEPFGGVGVMIQSPTTTVVASESDQFSCPLEHRERLCEIAAQVAIFAGCDSLPPIRLDVLTNSEPHCGLGSGTQLSLAASEALLRSLQVDCENEHLALRIAERGKRSAVGIHGYFHGGMIFESGSHSSESLNPINQRVSLPSDWCVAVLKPSAGSGQVFGLNEVSKFSTLAPAADALRRSLFDIANRDLVPAASRGDFVGFSKSLQSYNWNSGRLFSSIQGGPYNGPEVTSLFAWLNDQGVIGVGQSSWGPGVFAWFETRRDAEKLVSRLPSGVALVTLTNAFDRSRLVTNSF